MPVYAYLISYIQVNVLRRSLRLCFLLWLFYLWDSIFYTVKFFIYTVELYFAATPRQKIIARELHLSSRSTATATANALSHSTATATPSRSLDPSLPLPSRSPYITAAYITSSILLSPMLLALIKQTFPPPRTWVSSSRS